MANPTKYLKPNVVFEPLIDSWYAWSHLLYPPTSALNLTGRQIKIMRSYIQAPHIHAAAVKNPKMRGGPFMDLEGNKVPEVKDLLEKTLQQREKLIGLSNAIRELEDILKTKALGQTLHPLYEEVPASLRGLVELTYDLHQRPGFRFFERLVYRSEYNLKKAQSIALWLTENDDRPFVLSTPRLAAEEVLHLDLPFDSPLIDRLAKMKKEPGDIDDLFELLEIPADKVALFRSFFTDTPPPSYVPYNGDKVRMRYFGHACILIETKDTTILVDPLVSYYGYPTEINRFSDLDLPPKIDYVLITHNHQDHIMLETLLALRHRIGKVVVPRAAEGSLQDHSLKLMFEEIGFSDVIEVGEMEVLKLEDFTLTGVPFMGEHGDLDVRCKICHHVDFGAFSMIFMADSCNVEPALYERVQKLTGDTDIIFLGMECQGAPVSWVYGPLFDETLAREKDESRRLSGSDYERGKDLIQHFNPKEVYVYAMGMEPWLVFISSIKYTSESHPIVQSDLLVDYCNRSGISSERLFGEKELLYEREMTQPG